jgi:tetraacyldisaccharide 4'-kinase
MSKKKVNPLLRALLLKPISWVYGAVTYVRNKMFDCGMLTQRSFDIPVLVVGNIAVGGTGKTPHTEYLVNLLYSRYNIGVLSRGYNRRTHGFVLATDHTGAREIGDEPYQIYRKFGKEVMVAVCEDRCKGIDKMRELNPNLNLIILDDAFQHRFVKPTASIVLTEHAYPIFDDHLLPDGRLREAPGALHRADIVIVTKCPDEMNPLDYRLFVKNLKLFPFQKLFFTKYTYGAPQPVFPVDGAEVNTPVLSALNDHDTIMALAGVANPKPFIKHLRKYRAKVKGLLFQDHHNFGVEDIRLLITRIKAMSSPERVIVVTTEKDAMRLRALTMIPKWLKSRMFYIPVTVQFIPNPSEENTTGAGSFAKALLGFLSPYPKQK